MELKRKKISRRQYTPTLVTGGLVLLMQSITANAAPPPNVIPAFSQSVADCFGESAQSYNGGSPIAEPGDGCQSYKQDLYENLQYGDDAQDKVAACADIQNVSFGSDNDYIYVEYDMAGGDIDDCSSLNTELDIDHIPEAPVDPVRPDLYLLLQPANCTDAGGWTEAQGGSVGYEMYSDGNDDVGGTNPRIGTDCDAVTFPAGCSDFDSSDNGFDNDLSKPQDVVYCRLVDIDGTNDGIQVAIAKSFGNINLTNTTRIRPFSNQQSSIGKDVMFWHDHNKPSDLGGERIDNITGFVIVSNVVPSATVEKTANPNNIVSGAAVTFSVVVNNTSTIPLTLTSLSDNIYGNITQVQGAITSTNCATGGVIGGLANYSCSFTANVTGEPGTETDTVTATLTCDNNACPLTPSDTADVEISAPDPNPSATVFKTANPTAVPETGGQVVFSVQVQNTGDTELTLNNLVDDIYGDITTTGNGITTTNCATGGTIPVGENYQCSFTVGNVAGTYDASFNPNTCTVGGEKDTVTATLGNLTPQDSACVEFQEVSFSATLEKTANPTSVLETGGEVVFSVRIDNTGEAPITLDDLVDDIYGDITTDGHDGITTTNCATGGEIAVDGNYQCSFTVASVSGSYNASFDPATCTVGGEKDTVTATLGNQTPSDSACVEFKQVSSTATVEKTANPNSVPETGGQVIFTVKVENTGNTPLTLDNLVDDIYGDITTDGHDGITTTDCATGGEIPVGEDYQCSFTVADVSGPYSELFNPETCTVGGEKDTVTATLGDLTPQGSACVEFEEVFFAADVEKTASITRLGEDGNVNFTVTVTNESENELVLTELVDSIFGDITQVQGAISQTSCNTLPETLSPSGEEGDSYTCDFTAFVEIPNSGLHVNIVTATLERRPEDPNPLKPSDDAVVREESIGSSGNAALVQYYTANAGWMTLLNVTNKSDDHLAVKVRFREHENSRDVLDFNVVMSPKDVWTGWVAAGPNGTRFFTRDSSCTSPILPKGPNGASFVDLVDSAYIGAYNDGGSTGINRAAEGHVELIVMGQNGNGNATTNGNPDYPTAYWADHEHLNCSIVDSNFVSGPGAVVPSWQNNIHTRTQNELSGNPAARSDFMGIPSANYAPLKVNVSYIQSQRGVGAGTTALHVQGFGPHNLVTAQEYPWFLEPTLASYSGLWGWDLPNDSIGSVRVINEWSVNQKTGASTDWIVGYPSKYLHVDIYDYLQAGANLVRLAAALGNGYCRPVPAGFDCNGQTAPTLVGALQASGDLDDVLGPFTEPFDGQSCDEVEFNLWDREENGVRGGGTSISPAPPIPASALCYETNVITFGGADSVLESRLAQTIDVSGLVSGASAGWLDLVFVNGRKPVSGFAMKERDFGNPTRNYGQLMDHAFRKYYGNERDLPNP